MAENDAGGAEREWLHDELPGGRGASDQGAGPSRVVAGEVVGALRRGVDVRAHLVVHAIEEIGGREVVHDHDAVVGQDLRDLVWLRGGREVLDGHGP